MYQPSSNMPIENFSVVQPSTQQKTFQEGNICRFSIPHNSIPFFDPHNSYLQVLMEANADTKLELNGSSDVIIKYIRLSVNGVVLEEIDEYNQLAQLYNTYGHDESSLEHEAVFTNNADCPNTTGLMGNQSVNVDNGQKKVKMIVPLKCLGMFSNLEVVPLVAFGNNLDVEIRFAPNSEVVKSYLRDGLSQDNNLTRIPATATIANTARLDANPFVFTLPYKGFTSVGDVPLQVGEYVELFDTQAVPVIITGSGGATRHPIASIARVATTGLTDNPNQIQLTITQAETNNTGAGIDVGHVKLVRTTANNAVPVLGKLEYSNVEFYFQKVVPPQQYIQSLKKQLASPQGFQYDTHTWTTYKSSLLTAVKGQTIEIPAYQSRAKSVVCVPRIGNQTITLALDNAMPTPQTAGKPRYEWRGQLQNLLDYQFQVNNGLRVPTRPVNLKVMNGSFLHNSAEHLIQITQALGSSNIGVKSIKEARDNFIIGRQLSKYGGTTNLKSAMRIYLNYSADTDPVCKIQPITFINHINRISVNSSGLQVFN